MQAIQGIYDNGRIKLDRKAPANKTKVIVVFTEEESKKNVCRGSVKDFAQTYGKHKG